MTDQIAKIAARRGYMAVRVRSRGPVGRGRKKAFNAASKQAWKETATYFHSHLRDKRFTASHAAAAGYTQRKGEGQPRGSKSFRRSYYGRKFASKYGGGRGQALPLFWTGDTKRKMRSANITSTSKGGKAAYRGASKFSFRHPKSRVRMNEEFRRILPDEIQLLAEVYDESLDRHWTDQSPS